MSAIAQSLAIGLLRLYKRIVSPWLPASCRFIPTCSEYAVAAIERHGICRGTLKATLRLLRCQPLCSGGFDPLV
ncbi:MAG TPA: membrane protein insertion efficiency factor YidD [Terriglobia bacterium]|nr:membrane protein insertion efficiency factor YidD [Terriglobia bacterium]